VAMAHDVKPIKLLNEIIQSWVGDEDKNVDIEFIDFLKKIICPICMDKIILETSTLWSHFLLEMHLWCYLCTKKVLFVDKNLV
jgi:hypothetical protein